MITVARPAPGPLPSVLVFRMCPADRPLVDEAVRALGPRSLCLRFARRVDPGLDLRWVDALEGPVHVAYGARGLAAHARAAGIPTLRASVLAGNRPALALMRRLGAGAVAVSRGTVELAADLEAP